MCRTLSYIIQTFSAEATFGAKLQTPVRMQLPAKYQVPGNAADFLINVRLSLNAGKCRLTELSGCLFGDKYHVRTTKLAVSCPRYCPRQCVALPEESDGHVSYAPSATCGILRESNVPVIRRGTSSPAVLYESASFFVPFRTLTILQTGWKRSTASSSTSCPTTHMYYTPCYRLIKPSKI